SPTAPERCTASLSVPSATDQRTSTGAWDCSLAWVVKYLNHFSASSAFAGRAATRSLRAARRLASLARGSALEDVAVVPVNGRVSPAPKNGLASVTGAAASGACTAVIVPTTH